MNWDSACGVDLGDTIVSLLSDNLFVHRLSERIEALVDGRRRVDFLFVSLLMTSR